MHRLWHLARMSQVREEECLDLRMDPRRMDLDRLVTAAAVAWTKKV